MALEEFVGLVGLIGGPEQVLLVGEGPSGTRARLQAFARELFAPEEEEEEEGGKEKVEKEEEKKEKLEGEEKEEEGEKEREKEEEKKEKERKEKGEKEKEKEREKEEEKKNEKEEEEAKKGEEEEVQKEKQKEEENAKGGKEEAAAACCNGAPSPASLPPRAPGREVRVRLGSASRALSAGLLLVLFGASPSLLAGRRRLLVLREILRDLRLRLDQASRQRPPLAVVGVAALGLQQSTEEEEAEEEEAALSQLQALLRRSFPPGTRATLQAALHRPGRGARGVREAACKALRAALLLRSSETDETETKKPKLPLFLQCLPWGRRRQHRKGHLGTDADKFNEDAPQDQDEGLALT